MTSRDKIVKIGLLSEVEKIIPEARTYIEEAYETRFLTKKQKEAKGKRVELWRIWNELEEPGRFGAGVEMDSQIVETAGEDTLLLGFNHIVSANNYDRRLRVQTRRNPPGLQIRQVATRDRNSYGGEKALMAVRRQKLA